MKRRTIILLLATQAALCALALLLGLGEGDALRLLFSFPWLYLAEGLRRLSLSGSLGNVVATIGYLAFSLLPLAYLWLRRRRGAAWGEQLAWAVLSCLLLAGLYLLINPAYLDTNLAWPGQQQLSQLSLGCLLWSALVCGLLLQLLPRRDGKDSTSLTASLRGLLLVIAVVLVWSVAAQGLGEMLQAWQQVQAANTMAVELRPTLILLILRWLGSSLPALLCLVVIYRADLLLQQLQADPYAQTTQTAATRLARVCRLSVLVIAVAALALNLLQFLLRAQLHDLSLQLYLPLSQLALAWAALLLARFVANGRRLKSENELFV